MRAAVWGVGRQEALGVIPKSLRIALVRNQGIGPRQAGRPAKAPCFPYQLDIAAVGELVCITAPVLILRVIVNTQGLWRLTKQRYLAIEDLLCFIDQGLTLVPQHST